MLIIPRVCNLARLFENQTNGKRSRIGFHPGRCAGKSCLGGDRYCRSCRKVRRSENRIVTAKSCVYGAVYKAAPWPGFFRRGVAYALLSQHHDCWIVPTIAAGPDWPTM